MLPSFACDDPLQARKRVHDNQLGHHFSVIGSIAYLNFALPFLTRPEPSIWLLLLLYLYLLQWLPSTLPLGYTT